ncbi:MAG: DUF3488 domain-containing protein, partial [Bifidobacteriaceae bacterium]|nr:DUF3488 domain-containing protein [Bifidobacteriaceae bacterium]
MFALVVALYLSLLVPLGFLAGGREWIAWFLGFGALVFVLGAVGRGIGLDPRKVGLIQILALPPAQIAAFAGQEAWFWVIPNREVVERFFDVGQALARSFLVEIAPLSPSTGLFALIGISGGLVAWACDWYTFALRVPANTGVFAALVLVVTVSFVREGLPVWAMAPTAAAYLGLLAVTAPGSRPRFGSLAVVAGGVSLGLVASLLPGLGGGPLVEGGNPGLIGAIALPGGEETVQRVSSRQALVDVSRDLVERGNFEVLRYATAAQEPVYLRLTALSRFDGGEWLHDEGPQESFSLPTDRDQDRAMAFDAPAQPVTGVDEVAVELVALDSPWLPAPYMTLDLWGAGGSVDVDTLDRTISAGGGGLPESYTALWGLPAGGVAGSRDA